MLTVLIILLVLAALYLLTLQGRRNHPLWKTFRHQRFCHRGYHDKPQIPENSLPAFRRAIDHGWGAELDVHLLKDGTLAVFHDSDLSRCAGVSGIIEDLTLPELKKLRLEGTDEQVPLFDEVLALFEDAAPLIIELKSANGNHFALSKAVCERLDSYKGNVLHRIVRPLLRAGRQEASPRDLPRPAVDEFLQGPVRPAVL